MDTILALAGLVLLAAMVGAAMCGEILAVAVATAAALFQMAGASVLLGVWYWVFLT